MKLRLGSIFLATAAVALSPAGSQVASSAPAPAPAATAPAATTAPDAGRLAVARQYVALVRPGGNSVEDMAAGVLDSSMRLLGDNPSDQERADLKRQVDLVVARFEPIVRKRGPLIDEAYAVAYADTFSVAELRELMVFAASPVGRKYLSTIAAVEYADAVMAAEEAMREELAPVFEDLRKMACAKAAAERVAMGDAKASCPLSRPDPSANG